MYTNVVVGINGLAGDRDAIALARALSSENARLALVNVRLMGTVPMRGSGGAFGQATETERSYDLLQRQRHAYAEEAETVRAVAMSVGAGLHQVAKDRAADLLVVGGTHRGFAARMLAGDDARAAVHHSPCAVAVAPPGYASGSGAIGTIGVAYDGSGPSEVALAHSALLAADLGAKLNLREVVELRIYGAVGWASAVAIVEDPEVLAAAAREGIGAIPGVAIDVVVGPVLTELAELSETVDLMVCGSRQQAAAERVLTGSTSDYLARHARCPLLVTPASDAEHVAAWHEIRQVGTAV
jgi:nucleotide-binding universal stress UspA family protein